MPNYYVNTNQQANGDHEVHTDGCSYPPDLANRHQLGWHATCHDAVRESKKTYPKSNGCYWCCSACHTS